MLFTREDIESEQDVRGVLRAEGRNLQKVVEHIAFDSQDFRWVITGAPSLDSPPHLRQRILIVLEAVDEWLTAAELAQHLPDVKLKTIQDTPSIMVREQPRPFVMDSEVARKGWPRRYHAINRRMILSFSSGKDNGNDWTGLEEEIWVWFLTTLHD